jgi:outer membrane protein assembly factor BamB
MITACRNSIALKDANHNGIGIMTYGPNLQRNFYINEELNYEDLEVFWENETHGSFDNFSVTMYDNFVFVPDLAGRVYVFDKETGKMYGHEDNDGEMPVTVNINNNKIYYFINNTKERYFTLNIFNYRFGSLYKEIKIKGKCSNEPLKLSDGLIILTEEGRLLKFDFIGENIWEYDSKEISISDPACMGDNIYWGTVKGNLISVDARNGELNYKNKISNSRIEAGITLIENRGYIGDVEGTLFKININKGVVEDRIMLDARTKSNPVINNSKLFIGDMSGNIYSIDINEMEIDWTTFVEGIINTTPLLFNNILVQPNLNKKVHFININNGNIEKEFEYDSRVKMTPVYFDNTLYIGIDRGILFAYKTKFN